MNIHKNKSNKQSLISRSILTTSIFKTVPKKDFNNQDLSIYKNKEYSVELNGYQPNLDIDFNIFALIVRENKTENEFCIDNIIEKLNHKGRIQKRDRERVLFSLKRMMQTIISVKSDNMDYSFTLINNYIYNNETKKISIDISNVKKLYDKELFKRFISIKDIVNLSQPEKAIYLLTKAHTKGTYIKEKDLFERIGYDSDISDYNKRSKVKKVLKDLKRKGLILNYTIKSDVYEILNIKNNTEDNTEDNKEDNKESKEDNKTNKKEDKKNNEQPFSFDTRGIY